MGLMFEFDKKRRIRNINKMQCEEILLKEKQSEKEMFKQKHRLDNFLKDKKFYSQKSENLWHNKNLFSKKQLKLYHVPNDTSNKKFKKNFNNIFMKEKALENENKRRRLQNLKDESKLLRKKRAMERTALQKLSNQHVADKDKSPLNHVQMLSRATTVNLARSKTRPVSANYLRKPGCGWNNYKQKSSKFLQTEFTDKVIQGEDRAVQMINNRINDQIKAQSMILEKRNLFRKGEMDKMRKIKQRGKRVKVSRCLERSQTGRKSSRRGKGKNQKGKGILIKSTTLLKRSKSQNDKPLLKNDKMVKEICTKFGNFHEAKIREEQLDTKRLHLNRIDHYEEFRNMPIRDARARSILIPDNNFVRRFTDVSKFASEPVEKKHRLSGRKQKIESVMKNDSNGKLRFSKKGDRSARARKIRPYSSVDVKRRRTLYGKTPFKRKFMSKDAMYRSQMKPIERDSVDNDDIVNPLNTKNVLFPIFIFLEYFERD